MCGKPYEGDELLSLKSITPIDRANAVTQGQICQASIAQFRSNLTCLYFTYLPVPSSHFIFHFNHTVHGLAHSKIMGPTLIPTGEMI